MLLAAATAVAAPRTLVDLDWSHDAGGVTTVVVTVDADLEAAGFRSYPVSDPPRAVVVIRGVTASRQPRAIPVGDANLVRIRTGLHRDGGTPEVHIVLDLADPSIRILETSHTGPVVRVVLGQPPSAESVARPPTPTPPPATPTRARETAAPTGSPRIGTAAGPAAVRPSPVARPASGPAERVTEISASPRGDGSTLLLVTADGRLADSCARVIEVADEPARIVVTLRGLSAPDLPRSLEIGDEILERVRLVHDAETSDGELHLVLHLGDGSVTVTDVNQVGEHLVVRLARPAPGASTP